MTERPLSIRDARAICKTLGARGVITIAVHYDGRLSAASYGATKTDCAEVGRLLDQAYDALLDGRPVANQSAVELAARQALRHLYAIGWPEDAEVIAELQRALGAYSVTVGHDPHDDPVCTNCGHVASDHRPQIGGGACGASITDDEERAACCACPRYEPEVARG